MLQLWTSLQDTSLQSYQVSNQCSADVGNCGLQDTSLQTHQIWNQCSLVLHTFLTTLRCYSYGPAYRTPPSSPGVNKKSKNKYLDIDGFWPFSVIWTYKGVIFEIDKNYQQIRLSETTIYNIYIFNFFIFKCSFSALPPPLPQSIFLCILNFHKTAYWAASWALS